MNKINGIASKVANVIKNAFVEVSKSEECMIDCQNVKNRIRYTVGSYKRGRFIDVTIYIEEKIIEVDKGSDSLIRELKKVVENTEFFVDNCRLIKN